MHCEIDEAIKHGVAVTGGTAIKHRPEVDVE